MDIFVFRPSSFFLALIIPLMLLCVGCERGVNEAVQPQEEVPQQILHEFSTKHTEQGIIRWVLVADSAEFMKSVGYVQNPTVQIFENGDLVITVSGAHGEIIQSGHDIKIYENVVGTSQDGVLYTSELHWRNQAGKLYAPNECEIVRGESKMIGREMESEPSLKVVTMKDTRFKIYPKDEKIDATEN